MKSFIDRSDSHVYYNFVYSNLKDSNEVIDIVDNRNDYIVDKPNEWHMAITRFEIDTSLVPLMLWPKTTFGVFSPNNTYYSVTIDNGIEVKQSYLLYQNADEGYPEHDFTIQIFSFQSFVNSLNAAFIACCASFAAPIARSPYAIYDSTTGLINLVIPTPEFNTFKIFFNRNLYSLFQNFQVMPSTDPTTFGRDYRIKFSVLGNNQIAATTPPAGAGAVGTGLYVYAQFCNLGQLCSVRKIVFTSSRLPIKSEYIPNNVSNSNNLTSTNTAKIITDFEINLEGKNAQDIRSIQHYNVSSEYRLMDLTSDRPLTTLDLSVFWVDYEGNYHAVQLHKNAYVSAKIMFRRKNIKTYI